MAQLNWLDEYSVGVEELDFHHKKIFSLINDLRSSLVKKELSTEDILLELRDYADYHLSTEENYFEKFNYKKAKKHIKYHNIYRKKIDKFINEKNTKNFKIEKLLIFLEKWWIQHILHEDMLYKDFFNDHGLY